MYNAHVTSARVYKPLSLSLSPTMYKAKQILSEEMNIMKDNYFSGCSDLFRLYVCAQNKRYIFGSCVHYAYSIKDCTVLDFAVCVPRLVFRHTTYITYIYVYLNKGRNA